MSNSKNHVKFAVIGAGSVSFCPATVADILLSGPFAEIGDLEIYLMDIRREALDVSKAYCEKLAARIGRKITLRASTDLAEAVYGADFVVSAVEVDRYHYWSQDFHIPRRYGFRQIMGENGGPGGMFHTLRNLPPILKVAREMERGCPDAWLLNYSNPEAKLVEGVSKLSKTKAVGLCHGEQMGMDQLAAFLDMPKERIAANPVGINHFGWFTKVWDKETGEDLYPKLREMERKAAPLAHWDEFALPRVMLRTYGLWAYPGANHVGEYIAWSDGFLASASLQFYFDPASEYPWKTKNAPEFVYSFSGNPTDRPYYADKDKDKDKANNKAKADDKDKADAAYSARFNADGRAMRASGEYGVPIAEAIFFDKSAVIGAVNMPNKGYAADLPRDMVIELPAVADGNGLHPKKCDPLPAAVAAMICLQGAIHKLVIEAYEEQSRNKLLQAMLLDPTVSGYANAVAVINDLCELQKDILPPLHW